jgi:hypothetical protein
MKLHCRTQFNNHKDVRLFELTSSINMASCYLQLFLIVLSVNDVQKGL